jgi:serine/threonine protein kinase
MQSDDVNKD